MNIIVQLGAAFMWLFNIKEVKAPLPEEFTMAPSAGRSFINDDQYDPERILRMTSENYEAAPVATAVELVVPSENPTAD